MRKETKRLLKQAYKSAIRASQKDGKNYVNPWFFLGYLEVNPFYNLRNMPSEEVFRIMKWLWEWDRKGKFFA